LEADDGVHGNMFAAREIGSPLHRALRLGSRLHRAPRSVQVTGRRTSTTGRGLQRAGAERQRGGEAPRGISVSSRLEDARAAAALTQDPYVEILEVVGWAY